MGGKKDRIVPDDAPLTNNPFSTLLGLRAALPSAPTDALTSAAEAPTTTARFHDKVVVRRERKGHGGKTVTVVSGVVDKSCADVVRSLKGSLGTGARLDGADIVIQGDLVDRTIAALETLGAKRIVRGN